MSESQLQICPKLNRYNTSIYYELKNKKNKNTHEKSEHPLNSIEEENMKSIILPT